MDVLTPDFYSYAWVPLVDARVDGRFVVLTWGDGVEYRAFDLWLRENAVGAGGVDAATREGIMDPAHHCDDAVTASANVQPDGALAVEWKPDLAHAIYHPGWLRHVAENQHVPSTFVPDPVPWESADNNGEPRTYEGASVMNDSATMRDWINDLLRYGIARLRNTPADQDFLLAFAARVGPVRDTNFGPIWDVKADISMAGADDTNSTANTNLRLPPHTDLPTRETPPGFQFLHCLVNETEGGNSTMADGGKRHLRGIYINQDEVRSFARVANRRDQLSLES